MVKSLSFLEFLTAALLPMAAKSPSSNYASKFNTINDLFDDLLIEIFCRLPCNSLFTCKSVSKRWFALVSDPKFHSLYLNHQRTIFQNLQAQGEDPDQHAFILNPYNALVIAPKVPSLQLRSLEKHLSLSFPGSDFETPNVIPKLRSVWKFVFGCSNGLLLCANPRPQHKCKYQICNPLTKESLELPCAPTVCDNAGVLLGFSCDSYYHVEAERVSLASHRRFRVVRIPCFSDTRFAFNVEVFSSETWQWTQLVVSCAKAFSSGFFLTVSSVDHNGKLYFKCGRGTLVYDPYDNDPVASVIDHPSDFGEAYRGCLGVSCGRLQLSEFPIARPNHVAANMNMRPYSGRVWELEHCERREAAAWRLLHEFYLPNIVEPTIFEELRAIEREHVRGCGRILAFHPHDKGTMFLKLGDRILSCNLLTQRSKATKYGGLSLMFYPLTSVVLPWWPTPIPSPPSPVDHCV